MNKYRVGAWLRIIALIWLVVILGWGLGTGSAAQGDGLSVTVASVDDEAFPQVETWVAVTDESGLPVVGLTKAAFWVAEGGTQVPSESVQVVSEAIPNGAIVLVLDLSIDEKAWPVVQGAAQALINTLGEDESSLHRAQVAVVAFGDQVKVAQEWGTPQEAIAAMKELSVGGRFSALNQAIIQAAALIETSPLAHKAVIVLTDSADNTGKPSAQETLKQVEQAQVPVYIVGFGSKIASSQVPELKSLASATGGQAFILAKPQQVTKAVGIIGVLLRQGYRVTFISSLPADGAEHELTLGVIGGGADETLPRKGQGTARFIARPGQVIVQIVGLTEGQTVGGVIPLAALAGGPAPIVRVEYLLDEQSLGQATDPPYRFDWDSTTIKSGEHALVARAVDKAGNRGEARVKLDVALPLVVKMVSSPDQVAPGQQVDVQARVSTVSQVAAVEWTLDGQLIGSGASAGDGLFEFSFDSGNYLAGEHTLTVRARDSLGRWAEDSQMVLFMAAPTPTPTPLPTPTPMPEPSPKPLPWQPWLRVGTIVVVTAAVLATAVLLTAWLVAWQRKRRQTVLQMELANLGNVRSRYELRLDSPDKALKAQFVARSNGGTGFQRLAERQVSEIVEVSETQPSPRTLSRPSSRSPKARNSLGLGRAIVGTVADVLVTLGGILPRSVGEPLYRTGSKMRSGLITANRVEQASSRVADATSAVSTPSDRKEQPVPVTRTVVHTWSQTVFVEPGQVLKIDLCVDPVRLFRVRPCTFRVLSRSLDQPDAPLMIEEKTIQIAGFSLFHRAWPFLVIYGTAAAILIVVLRLASTGLL